MSLAIKLNHSGDLITIALGLTWWLHWLILNWGGGSFFVFWRFLEGGLGGQERGRERGRERGKGGKDNEYRAGMDRLIRLRETQYQDSKIKILGNAALAALTCIQSYSVPHSAL